MYTSSKTGLARFATFCEGSIVRTGWTIGLVAAVAMGMSNSAHAADWLMLQGTSPANAPAVKLWGFIQPTYQQDFSDANAQGLYVPPKLIGPNLDDQSAFNILRARIGVRGRLSPHSNDIDYFLLTELGNNGITNGGRYGSYSPWLTDASITLNYIKGARVRLGLFKTPGAEEALQGIQSFTYINFTNVTNQLLNERFPSIGESNIKPQPTPNANMNGFSKPVGAFRDTGVEVFDTFKSGNWEHSYAVMLGNGNGLGMSDNNGSKDYYLYWSSAYVFNKKVKGIFRPDMKFFAWYQGGKRTNAYNVSQEQNRKRYGAGVTYRKRSFHATGEYMWGQGMIFQGAQNPQGIFNNSRSNGGYVEGGWDIPSTPWELDLRYDTYIRNKGLPIEATFRSMTAGVQYHFTKLDRVTLNYAFNDFSSHAAGINKQLAGVNGRLSLQVTVVF